MWEKIRKNFEKGLDSLKWFTVFLAERTKAETSMARLLYESNKLEKKIDEVYRDIGKRIFDLREKGEKIKLKDPIILQGLDEIVRLRQEIEDCKSKSRELGKPNI
ncbi:MAG TPA: hypothetical protein DEP99_02210 [Nitrospiraceae bacterium]|nr:hypothetical protein [Nitrospiraceae bacterium]